MLEDTRESARCALTRRELEILVLVGRGLSNRQIASCLHVSESTVKRHLANVYPKIGVRCRGEAVRKALCEGWISAEDLTEDRGPVPQDYSRARQEIYEGAL